jgi:hypothetical protein
LAPLWEEGVRDLTPLLEKRKTLQGQTQTYILNAASIHAKLHSGDKTRPTSSLETTISTLRATLALPTAHEHRKLPKDTTSQTHVIHATWERYFDYENIPKTKPPNYETITTHPSVGRGAIKRHQATHIEDTYMTPIENIHTTYDILEIQDHGQLNTQTTYLVTQWSPEIFTREQIDVCINEGFQIKHIHLIIRNTGQPTYKVY